MLSLALSLPFFSTSQLDSTITEGYYRSLDNSVSSDQPVTTITGAGLSGNPYAIDTSSYLPIDLKFPFKPFASLSTGVSYYGDYNISAEVGAWGVASIFSASAVVDVVRSKDAPHPWDVLVGIKPYFRFAELPEQRLSFMVYAAPKLKVTNDKYIILEEGVSAYYLLKNSTALSYTFAIEHSKIINYAPIISLGIIHLIK